MERGTRRGFEVTAPELEPVATVGSGDAFLAGFAAARFDGRPAEECLRFAVACGAESTQHFGAGTIDPDEVERIASRVEVESLDAPAAVTLSQPVYRCYRRTGRWSSTTRQRRKERFSSSDAPACRGFFVRERT